MDLKKIKFIAILILNITTQTTSFAIKGGNNKATVSPSPNTGKFNSKLLAHVKNLGYKKMTAAQKALILRAQAKQKQKQSGTGTGPNTNQQGSKKIVVSTKAPRPKFGQGYGPKLQSIRGRNLPMGKKPIRLPLKQVGQVAKSKPNQKPINVVQVKQTKPQPNPEAQLPKDLETRLTRLENAISAMGKIYKTGLLPITTKNKDDLKLVKQYMNNISNIMKSSYKDRNELRKEIVELKDSHQSVLDKLEHIQQVAYSDDSDMESSALTLSDYGIDDYGEAFDVINYK